jgi:hypothetical protein
MVHHCNFEALLWTIKDRKRYLNFQHDTALAHTRDSSVQLLQTIFDESVDSWGLCLPLYQSLNMGNFYLQLQLPRKKFTTTYIFRMLHKLRGEMLFLKCSLKLLHKCKMPIGLAATAAWGGQSSFYYDMHAWNLQFDYEVVVSILILVTPNTGQHLTECKSSSRNEPLSICRVWSVQCDKQ